MHTTYFRFGMALLLIICFLTRIITPHPGPTWDEAMNLLSTEAVMRGSDHVYSYWFWRHPPLYKALLSLGYARPYPDWLSNMQVIHAGLSTLNLLLLVWVLKQTASIKTALLAGVFWILLPGVRFYDPWIKADLLVITFGLAAVGFVSRKNLVRGGLMLGLGLLTKETAAIWVVPMALFMPWKDSLRSSLIPFAIALGFCLPWYAFRIPELTHYLAFSTGLPLKDTEDWFAPWYTYWIQVPLLLGPAGMICLIPNLASRQKSLQRYWPLALLLAGLTILSLIRGKPPWLLITFQPALAALCGMGVACGLRWLEDHGGRKLGQAFLVVTVLALSVQAWAFDSDALLRRLSPSTHWGTHSSQEAAALIETQVSANETFAVSPMYYWEGQENVICPILLCSLTRSPDMLIIPPPKTRQEYINLLRASPVTWMLVSPTPANAEAELFPLSREGRVQIIPSQGALLMKPLSL